MAVLLIAVMLAALSNTAFAASVTITQPPPEDGTAGAETYELYKIFDVTKTSSVTDPVTTDDSIEAQSEQGYTAPSGFAYTISTGSGWFGKLGTVDSTTGVWTAAEGQTWVTLYPTAGDSTKFNVTWVGAQTETAAIEFARWLLANKGTITADANMTSTSGTATKTDVADGYYLITSSLGTNLVLATSNISIKTKNEYITDEKAVEKSNYSIGDHVLYTITVNLPATVDYTKPVIIHDTMDDMLSVDTGSIHGKVSADQDFDSHITYVPSTSFDTGHDNTNHAAATGKMLFDLVLDISSLAPASGTEPTEKTITITYTAELLDEALADTGYINREYVEYSKYRTTPNDVTVMTFDFDLEKTFVGDENNKDLKATFQLYNESVTYTEDANGTYYLLSNGNYTAVAPDGTNDADYRSTTTRYTRNSAPGSSAVQLITDTAVSGKSCYVLPDSQSTAQPTPNIVVTQGTLTNVRGLKAGTYYLIETETASGYNMMADTITVIIDDNGNVTYSYGTTSSTGTITVANQTGTVLPSTGGVGTAVFYVVGGLVLAGAALLLIKKKRGGEH